MESLHYRHCEVLPECEAIHKTINFTKSAESQTESLKDSSDSVESCDLQNRLPRGYASRNDDNTSDSTQKLRNLAIIERRFCFLLSSL